MSMPSFDFRLPFKFPNNTHIDHNDEELLILEEPDGKRLRLRSGQLGTPISAHSQAAIIGGPYPSIEAGRKAAEQAKRALLIWAVRQRIGIDFGDGIPRSILTDAGREMFESKLKRPVRNEIPGIDVYRRQEGLVFVRTDADISLGKGAEAFADQVASAFRVPLVLTEKQILSTELYCASFFDVSFRSRLITLVTAVEALLDPSKRPKPVQELVAKLELAVLQADIEKPTKDAMIGSIQWLKMDSIGQAGRELAHRLLGERTYFDMTASRFITYCYQLRSQILHFGQPEDKKLDLLMVTNACQAFVADLLLASISLSI